MSGNTRGLSGYQRNGGDAGTEPETAMRTTSLILAFILVGPSMAGSLDDGLPGAGTFAYNASPLANPAHQPILVAAK